MAVTNLAIREVTQEDAPQIAGLLTQLGYPSSADDVTSRLAYWKPDPLSLILIAERAERALGCLSLGANRKPGSRRISAALEQAAPFLPPPRPPPGDGGCLAIEITSARTREAAHVFYRHMGYSDVCDRSARFHKVL